MKTSSVDWAGNGWALVYVVGLEPLVRIKSVPPSGLMAVVIGWSIVKSGRSARSGFKACKVDPFAAVGVILMPVGRVSPVTAWGACDFGLGSAANSGRLAKRKMTIGQRGSLCVFIVGSVRFVLVDLHCAVLFQILLQLLRSNLTQGIIHHRRYP